MTRRICDSILLLTVVFRCGDVKHIRRSSRQWLISFATNCVDESPSHSHVSDSIRGNRSFNRASQSLVRGGGGGGGELPRHSQSPNDTDGKSFLICASCSFFRLSRCVDERQHVASSEEIKILAKARERKENERKRTMFSQMYLNEE